jgi:hypothetical protein|tara:strand:- start:56 stop:370 length:315 start_codon:yes stop_codon:yes gene_type:complete
MAFKLSNPPYVVDNTPIYRVSMEEGVMGKANNNGSIVLNMDLDPSQVDDVVAHEKIHLEQMERGDLDYDDDNVYWKGKKYSRSEMEEGAKDLPWEAEAYKRSNT